MTSGDWVRFARHDETGIETLQAHFEGHAFDPHWHDTYLIGVTEQGVQRFSCGRAQHDSTPGQVMLLEPGEVHDGDAPTPGGFTYQVMYLTPQWLDTALRDLFEQVPDGFQLGFSAPLISDPQLARAINQAFMILHQPVHGHPPALRMVRDTALDHLLHQLTRQAHWRRPLASSPMPRSVQRAREFLHAHFAEDIGLDALARAAGTDRFRLARAFKCVTGLPPHAYLVQLRLNRARQLLARGLSPVSVAAAVGFADQSHLGRWFRRAYGLTPARYRRQCSNLPD